MRNIEAVRQQLATTSANNSRAQQVRYISSYNSANNPPLQRDAWRGQRGDLIDQEDDYCVASRAVAGELNVFGNASVPLQVFSLEGQFIKARSKKDLNYMKEKFEKNSQMLSTQQSQLEQESLMQSSMQVQPDKVLNEDFKGRTQPKRTGKQRQKSSESIKATQSSVRQIPPAGRTQPIEPELLKKKRKSGSSFALMPQLSIDGERMDQSVGSIGRQSSEMRVPLKVETGNLPEELTVKTMKLEPKQLSLKQRQSSRTNLDIKVLLDQGRDRSHERTQTQKLSPEMTLTKPQKIMGGVTGSNDGKLNISPVRRGSDMVGSDCQSFRKIADAINHVAEESKESGSPRRSVIGQEFTINMLNTYHSQEAGTHESTEDGQEKQYVTSVRFSGRTTTKNVAASVRESIIKKTPVGSPDPTLIRRETFGLQQPSQKQLLMEEYQKVDENHDDFAKGSKLKLSLEQDQYFKKRMASQVDIYQNTASKSALVAQLCQFREKKSASGSVTSCDEAAEHQSMISSAQKKELKAAAAEITNSETYTQVLNHRMHPKILDTEIKNQPAPLSGNTSVQVDQKQIQTTFQTLSITNSLELDGKGTTAVVYTDYNDLQNAQPLIKAQSQAALVLEKNQSGVKSSKNRQISHAQITISSRPEDKAISVDVEKFIVQGVDVRSLAYQSSGGNLVKSNDIISFGGKRTAEMAQNTSKKRSLRYSKSTVFNKDEFAKESSLGASQKEAITNCNKRIESSLSKKMQPSSAASGKVQRQFSKRHHVKQLSNISTHEIKRRLHHQLSNGTIKSLDSLGSGRVLKVEKTHQSLAQVQEADYHKKILLSKQSMMQNKLLISNKDKQKLTRVERRNRRYIQTDPAMTEPVLKQITMKSGDSSTKRSELRSSQERMNLKKFLHESHSKWDRNRQEPQTAQQPRKMKNLERSEEPYQDDLKTVDLQLRSGNTQGQSGDGHLFPGRQQTQTGLNTKKLSHIDLQKIRVIVSERKHFETAVDRSSNEKQSLFDQSQKGYGSKNTNGGSEARPGHPYYQVRNGTQLLQNPKKVVASGGLNRLGEVKNEKAYASVAAISGKSVEDHQNSLFSGEPSLSIVISEEKDSVVALRGGNTDPHHNYQHTPNNRQRNQWREFIRDEQNLIKCHKNAFGSKGYNLGVDKSALSHHVHKILKSNMTQKKAQLSRPYLIKQASTSNFVSQELNLLLEGASPAELKAAGKIAVSLSPQSRRETKAAVASNERTDNQERQLKHGNAVSASNSVDKLRVAKLASYNTKGSQFRSRVDQPDAPAAKVNSTTMAQWLRHCSPDAIQAQLYKLKALKIDKLNIDYKIVDRSSQERPYLESSGSDDDDEEDNPHDGNANSYKLDCQAKVRGDNVSTPNQLDTIQSGQPSKAASNPRPSGSNRLLRRKESQTAENLSQARVLYSTRDLNSLSNERQAENRAPPPTNQNPHDSSFKGRKDSRRRHVVAHRNILTTSPSISQLKKVPNAEHTRLALLMNKALSPRRQDMNRNKQFQSRTQEDVRENQGLTHHQTFDSLGTEAQKQQQLSIKNSLRAKQPDPSLESFLGLYRAPLNMVSQSKRLKNSFRSHHQTINHSGQQPGALLSARSKLKWEGEMSAENLGVLKNQSGGGLIKDSSIQVIKTEHTGADSARYKSQPQLQIPRRKHNRDYDSIKIVHRPKRVAPFGSGGPKNKLLLDKKASQTSTNVRTSQDREHLQALGPVYHETTNVIQFGTLQHKASHGDDIIPETSVFNRRGPQVTTIPVKYDQIKQRQYNPTLGVPSGGLLSNKQTTSASTPYQRPSITTGKASSSQRSQLKIREPISNINKSAKQVQCAYFPRLN